ncbi:hypothetical protein AB0L74_30810 [Streptomyces sp. NPDC052020]|uniref:hypothetical protein n=1 Tax=Streptomyces sp. NPDC052020 TaxID=3155677 RepID=UPI00342D921C
MAAQPAATDSSCLLDYDIISDPHPLQAASTNSDTQRATLRIIVSNGGKQPVYCKNIFLSLPHGDNIAQCLLKSGATDGDGSAVDSNGTAWTVTNVQKGVLDFLPQGDYAHFKTAPGDSETQHAELSATSLTITIKNLQINTVPGVARIEIREMSTHDTETWPALHRDGKIQITKHPRLTGVRQLAYDFQADPPEVECGGQVHLTWRGPDVAYTVEHGTGAEKVNKNRQETEKEYKAKVYRNSTFRVSYVVEEVTHYLTTTVTVKDPQYTGITVKGGGISVEDAPGDVFSATHKEPMGRIFINSKGEIGDDGELKVRGDIRVYGKITPIPGGIDAMEGPAKLIGNPRILYTFGDYPTEHMRAKASFRIGTANGLLMAYAEILELGHHFKLEVNGYRLDVTGDPHVLRYLTIPMMAGIRVDLKLDRTVKARGVMFWHSLGGGLKPDYVKWEPIEAE